MKVGSEIKEEFNLVYDYIRFDLLGYTKEMAMPKAFTSRLYGIACGKVYYTPSQKGKDEGMPIIYSFKMILATLIEYRPQIEYCLKTIRFKDEAHRVNTILKIIGDNINTIYIREINRKKEALKMDAVDTEHMVREVQPYNKESKLKDKFKELL